MDADNKAKTPKSDAPQEDNDEAEPLPEKDIISTLEGLTLPPLEDPPKKRTQKSLIETMIIYPTP